MARIPKPQKLAILRGDKNKRRTDPEPVPSSDHPMCPDTLDAEGKAHWHQTVKNLDEMGLLTRTDQDALTLYCEAWARMRRNRKTLDQQGDYYELSNGFLQIRPEYAAFQKDQETCRRLMIEFGMTPSARSRLAIQNKKSSSAWGDFFDG